jgi:hypothetical protein
MTTTHSQTGLLYDRIGRTYGGQRRIEPRLADWIWAARHDCASTVVREAEARAVTALRADLDSGRWHERNAELLDVEEVECGARLLVAG